MTDDHPRRDYGEYVIVYAVALIVVYAIVAGGVWVFFF